MMTGSSGGVLLSARDRVRAGLEAVSRELEAADMPSPGWKGKLIRPVMGYAGGGEADGDHALWRALAAVQLAHEASLLHDDVIDGASERRGEPTVAASRGVATALVQGDHLLTSAYRVAAATGSGAWMEAFARAVERTVAGEKAQAAAAGRELDWAEYEAIVLGKSGELVGAAFSAPAMLRDAWNAHRYFEVGRRVGLVYQMLDDLLDYSRHMNTGKPALIDYRRGLWTWPRLYLDLPAGLEDREVVERFHRADAEGVSPVRRCLERYRSEVESVRAEARELLPDDRLLNALLDSWLERAEAAAAPPQVSLPPVEGWEAFMAEHAKSFRFASRLFPAEYRDRVTSVYAWCRYTDDLVDEVDLPAPELEARLDAWLTLSRRAYEGEETGNELADRVMREMREAEVPFGYAEELVEGMRMDIRGVEYGTLSELWRYTYRVASVVGLWMTELFGIRDPWMLDRAASLGHAMQLTNILRDVGEDLEAGRLYLPKAWLRAYDLDRSDLERMAGTGEVDDRYRALIERLLQVAESEYEHADPAIDRLPDFYRRPVAVAADVYRGIHDEVRGNDYDNLTRRAYTGMMTKLRLGAGALFRRRGGDTVDAASSAARAAAMFAISCLLVAVPAPGAAQASSGGGPSSETRAEAPAADEPGEAAFLRIGELWVQGVEDEEAVDRGLDAVERLRRALDPVAADQDRRLRMYQGAFTALRAKHGAWPPARMRHLREGFTLMDAAVGEAPDDAELRYVRLMSGFYLPGIFGRSEEVDQDMAALVRLLPDSRDAFPSSLFPEVVSFVLENADLDPSEREKLRTLLT